MEISCFDKFGRLRIHESIFRVYGAVEPVRKRLALPARSYVCSIAKAPTSSTSESISVSNITKTGASDGPCVRAVFKLKKGTRARKRAKEKIIALKKEISTGTQSAFPTGGLKKVNFRSGYLFWQKLFKKSVTMGAPGKINKVTLSRNNPQSSEMNFTQPFRTATRLRSSAKQPSLTTGINRSAEIRGTQIPGLFRVCQFARS